jgi:hypothetical protein
MTFRFRKSVRLMPGVRLNFSKHGTSLSVGVPGTGLSWSKHTPWEARRAQRPAPYS